MRFPSPSPGPCPSSRRRCLVLLLLRVGSLGRARFSALRCLMHPVRGRDVLVEGSLSLRLGLSGFMLDLELVEYGDLRLKSRREHALMLWLWLRLSGR